MNREIKFRAWDGDDSISHKDGEYIYVKADWHPHANKRGYVKRHRLVLEKKLGYYIPKKSIVHHKDDDKHNDSPDNLELIPNQSLHAKSHDQSTRNKNGQFVASDPIFNEIKFRLFNKHTKQYEIYTLGKLIRTTFRNSQFKFAGRYTGLKDKNGKEIYEGDVLEFADKWEWYKGSYGIKMAFADPERKKELQAQYDAEPMERRVVEIPSDYEWLLSSEIQTYWHVIGNIYQNHELL